MNSPARNRLPSLATAGSIHSGVTLVEILVLITIAGTLVALLVPAPQPPPPLTDQDLQLDNWQPGPQHQAVPPETNWIRDVKLAGEWADRSHWTSMTLSPIARNRYRVAFLSHARCGMSGYVQLERTAQYTNGVLTLDRPVQELLGATYQKLFTLRLDGHIHLVPSIRVNKLEDKETPSSRGVFSRTDDEDN